MWVLVLLKPFEPVVLQFVAYDLGVYLVVWAFPEILLDAGGDGLAVVVADLLHGVGEAGFEVLLVFLCQCF